MTPELTRRIAFTLGALLVFRLGANIPIPGLDLADPISGATLARLGIFALGITPYLTVAIIVQLATLFVPKLRALREGGVRGRARITRWTLAITAIFAALQAYGLAVGIEHVGVIEPGLLFRATTVLTLTGGTLLLAWLADQITLRGIANGVAVLLLAGVIVKLPSEVAKALQLYRQGFVSTDVMTVGAALTVALVTAVVVMERARRLIGVTFSGPQLGDRVLSSDLALKMNNAGWVPAFVVSLILSLVMTIVSLMALAGDWWPAVAPIFDDGRPGFLAAYGLLIMFFVFLYTALLLDPDRTAASLQARGGQLAGVAPGEPTADYFDFVLTRTTAMGAVYLALVCLIPEILLAYFRVPLVFSGASLLIAVCAMVDIEAQVRGFAANRA
jgi:preprotein translocase subunit SecY